MISYIEVLIHQLDDYDDTEEINGVAYYKKRTLAYNIPEAFLDDDVVSKMKKYIGVRCNRIIIEFPYYDRDYLSTYYIHYSKKMVSVTKSCCRLHFWKGDRYYGYMVLRPTTTETKISRTLLEPELLVDQHPYLMLANFKAHLLGSKANIRCFPWMRQETDIAVCAHVAVWSLLKYYGNSFKDYMDTTVGAIVEKTTNSWGRKTPSLGLSPVQISDIMKEYGFSPLILGRNSMDKEQFLDTLMSYVESGIPSIGFIDINEDHHAVTFIGHGVPQYEILDDDKILRKLIDQENIENNIQILPSARLINTLYVSDDRAFPYRVVQREIPDSSSDLDYCLPQVRYVIIPLYQRMQLGYREIYAKFIELYKKQEFQWVGLHISRIYITSSNALKEQMMNCDVNAELKRMILHLSMSKFVWCVDLATPEEYKSNKISGRLIADTTAATYELDPWILVHDSKLIQVFDAETQKRLRYKINIEPYDLYVHNLKPV